MDNIQLQEYFENALICPYCTLKVKQPSYIYPYHPTKRDIEVDIECATCKNKWTEVYTLYYLYRKP
jgi:C4-type Zn-finger protein